MKFISDFFPVVLFFTTYVLGSRMPATAQDLATNFLGGIVRGGTIPVDLAPIILASAVAIVAISIQMVYMVLRRHSISMIQWTTFALFVVFGGATIYLHNDVFIKWKPTVLYWLFSVVFLFAPVVSGKNLVRSMMEPSGVVLPASTWSRINLAWVLFFSCVGALNLYVAFRLPRDIWVTFKSFGLTGLTLAFVVIQSIVLARHVVPAGDEAASVQRGKHV